MATDSLPNSSQSGPSSARRRRPAHLMQVVGSERLSEHFQRLTFGGEGFDQFVEFDSQSTDRYIKFLLPPDPSVDIEPPYDLEQLRQQLPPEQVPVRRTYTVHSLDRTAKTFQVDFVLHGEQGVAGPWSQRAQIGDTVQFGGPGGKFNPDPTAKWHLLAGDEAALPAISAALAAMDENARGVALIEVASEADHWDLVHPQGVEVRWLHRGGEFTPQSTVLEQAVRELKWPENLDPKDVQAFVHGEREMMKALRGYLMDECGMDRSGLSLSAYWAYGRAEDAFQAEKSKRIGQIYPSEQPQY